MNGYFYVLTAIDLFVLSFMCILTKFSESLNKKQKRGFFLAFALIAGISVLEVVTLAVDGAPAGYRWLNILSNYLGFGLSPAVSLCLVYVMDRKKMVNFWFRAAVCCEGGYLLFLALSIPAGLVFSVGEDNVYSRGPYFCIYILMYLAAIVYLSASTIVTAREFQNRSRALIYPLMLFLTIETVIQVALPSLHVTWLCVTLLSVLYFIYCRGTKKSSLSFLTHPSTSLYNAIHRIIFQCQHCALFTHLYAVLHNFSAKWCSNGVPDRVIST